jgi:general stress protein 26
MEEKMPRDPQPGFAKLSKMIEAIEVGMVTSEDKNGSLHSRPLPTQRAESGFLWFFLSLNALVVSEVEGKPQVAVTYEDAGSHTYLSVSGAAEVIRDPAKTREFWSDYARPWFPKGPEDLNLGLLRVDVTEAAYWDEDTRQMKLLIEEGMRAA